MNNRITWMLFLFSTGIALFSGNHESSHEEKKQCATVFKELVVKYLTDNKTYLSIFTDKVEIDTNSLKFIASVDLDKGSKDLRREVKLSDNKGMSITLYTFGDMSCGNEKVLGIKSVESQQSPKADSKVQKILQPA